MKIKVNDTIIVIAGKDKGKHAKVLRVLKSEEKVVVEGVNMKKKHKRANKRGVKGEIISFAAPVHISNVMVEDPKSKKQTRVGYQIKDGKKVRIARKSGGVL